MGSIYILNAYYESYYKQLIHVYFSFFKNMHWTKTMPYIFCYSLISYMSQCRRKTKRFAHFHKALRMTLSQFVHLQTTIVNNLIFYHYFWIDLAVSFTALCGTSINVWLQEQPFLLLKYNILIQNIIWLFLFRSLYYFFCDYWQNETSPRPLKRWAVTVAPY